MSQPSPDVATHAQALADLEAGRPLPALRAWRQLLISNNAAVQAHLQAASQSLPIDAIAPLRRQAIDLASALLHHQPGESEISLLGRLLQGWGSLALAEVPSRALQHLERAWSCGRDPRLEQQLANLQARLGYGSGAHWLAPPSQPLGPWPPVPCPAQACIRCPQRPAPADQPLQLHCFEQGRVFVQRQRNPWRHSHGVAVIDQNGQLQTPLCRHYPWPWAGCPHQATWEHSALHQLLSTAKGLPPPLKVEGPVLAVAELSGEMFFHWQLELLPRLGRVWHQALSRWPDLRLWHNGGDQAYVRAGLERLGISPERCLPQVDHVQAPTLVVPNFIGSFGRPSRANLLWLEQFWQLHHHYDQSNGATPASGAWLWLGRQGASRRPVLSEANWCARLHAPQLQQRGLPDQFQQVAVADRFLAPHGAALANLIAGTPGSRVIELVNPAYQPEYFGALLAHRQLQHQRFEAASTPLPLQEWLYEGPLAFPIDLRQGASPAADLLASLLP